MLKKNLTLILGLMAASMAVYGADQTWDPDGNDINDGGAGTWDITTGNWISASPWVNGNNAIFGSGTYQVDLTSTGVTVGNLTYGGGGTLEFKGSSLTGLAGDTITINSGGATWNTGGGEIEFFNDGNNNNTRLAMTSGDTLTVQGGGTFDTGQNPQNNANGTWQVSGATLDVTEATTVRGDSITIGAFDTVKLVDGSTYIHERNSDRTYANNWELGAGTVKFDNRFGRSINLGGVISGDGRLRAEYLSGKQLTLQNAGNTFSGGVEAENARIQANSDGALGAAPVSFDADHIKLKNSQLRLAQGMTLNSNRGITIESGASIEATGTSAISYGGVITGTGGLTFGRAGQAGGTYLLSGNSDYTGGTTIYEGNVRVDTDEALGEGVLTIGGEGASRLILNRNSQTIGGLTTAGNNTREVVNLNSTATTLGTKGELIIDVADGESYTFGSAYGGNAATQEKGNFSTVKNGLGTQQINNMQTSGDLTVNNGLMIINDANANAAGATSVAGGTLRINDSLTSASYATSAGGTLQIGNAGTTGNIGNADISNDGTVVISRSDASANSGVISGSGSVKVTGGGTHTLSAAQTYTGDTTLDNAILTAGVANALSADSALRIGGAGSGTSAFEMNGLAQQIGGLNHEAGSHTREVRNNGADTTLTINVGTGENYTYNANVAGSGTIDLVKTGDGTQTLGRSGGYTTALGDVTVSGGELIWNNTGATVSGTMSVGASGTLSGSGVFGGAVTVAGSLNPGNSPGTMTFDEALTLESTATLTLEITGTAASLYDILLNDGEDTLTAGGTLLLDTTGYTAVLDDTFLVFENWAAFGGNFSDIQGTDLGGGLSLDTSDLLVDGTITVIPEPASLGLIALVGCGILFIRRRFMI